MKRLAGACDMLDEADARISMLSDLLGASAGDIEISQSGVVGLTGLMRELLSRIVAARAEIDRVRRGETLC